MPAQNNTGQTKSAKLRECSLCGKDVSAYSPFCRNCGHPQRSALAVWAVALFLIVLFAMYLATAFCLCNVYRFRASGDAEGRIERESEATKPDLEYDEP